MSSSPQQVQVETERSLVRSPEKGNSGHLILDPADKWEWKDEDQESVGGRLYDWLDEPVEWDSLSQFDESVQARRWLMMQLRHLDGPKGLATAVVARAVVDYLRGGELGREAGKFLASENCKLIVEGCGGSYCWPCPAVELLRE